MSDQYLPVSILETEYEELHAVRDKLARDVERLREQLGDATSELGGTEAKLAYIQQLIARARGMNSPRKQVVSGRGSFSRALIELVQREPGIRKLEAVDRLFDEHKSDKAENPRRSLITQISNLRRRGKLVVRGDQIFPVGHTGKEDGHHAPSD